MSTQREKEVESAAAAAMRNERAGWEQAAMVASSKKDEAQLIANRAQQEADMLRLQAKKKEDEASEARGQVSKLQTQEHNIHARAENAGDAPGVMDRVKAGLHSGVQSVRETFSGAAAPLQGTGETIKEKFASLKESAGEKMEQLGDKLAGKGKETQQEAAQQRGEALAAKTDLISSETERERMHESDQKGNNKFGKVVSEGNTSSGASFTESAAAKAERAAGAAADKAKELQNRAAEVRSQAHTERIE